MVVDTFNGLLSINYITVLIVCVIGASLALGFARGASASARQLFDLIADGVMSLITIIVAWQVTEALSPRLHKWLVDQQWVIPSEKLGTLEQLFYTLITGLRDFSLLRFAALFVIVYSIVRALLNLTFYIIIGRLKIISVDGQDQRSKTITSGLIGMGIGSTIGVARAFIMIAILFVYVTLQPQSVLSQYTQQSTLYQQAARQILAPFTEDFIETQVPVFTRAVEQEMSNILQRKYEIIDQHIPEDIAGAARQITQDKLSDEDKAYALYEWIGSRVKYDHEKVRMYEEENIWLEQSPEDTFNSRQGVCIDYARLYAVMARSVNLETKVITGLGYDGRGGYGPHAWNEVFVSEVGRWIPLDSTWASSGGNWFNPVGFEETHIQETEV